MYIFQLNSSHTSTEYADGQQVRLGKLRSDAGIFSPSDLSLLNVKL